MVENIGKRDGSHTNEGRETSSSRSVFPDAISSSNWVNSLLMDLNTNLAASRNLHRARERVQVAEIMAIPVEKNTRAASAKCEDTEDTRLPDVQKNHTAKPDRTFFPSVTHSHSTGSIESKIGNFDKITSLVRSKSTLFRPMFDSESRKKLQVDSTAEDLSRVSLGRNQSRSFKNHMQYKLSIGSSGSASRCSTGRCHFSKAEKATSVFTVDNISLRIRNSSSGAENDCLVPPLLHSLGNRIMAMRTPWRLPMKEKSLRNNIQQIVSFFRIFERFLRDYVSKMGRPNFPGLDYFYNNIYLNFGEIGKKVNEKSLSKFVERKELAVIGKNVYHLGSYGSNDIPFYFQKYVIFDLCLEGVTLACEHCDSFCRQILEFQMNSRGLPSMPYLVSVSSGALFWLNFYNRDNLVVFNYNSLNYNILLTFACTLLAADPTLLAADVDNMIMYSFDWRNDCRNTNKDHFVDGISGEFLKRLSSVTKRNEAEELPVLLPISMWPPSYKRYLSYFISLNSSVNFQSISVPQYILKNLFLVNCLLPGTDISIEIYQLDASGHKSGNYTPRSTSYNVRKRCSRYSSVFFKNCVCGGKVQSSGVTLRCCQEDYRIISNSLVSFRDNEYLEELTFDFNVGRDGDVRSLYISGDVLICLLAANKRQHKRVVATYGFNTAFLTGDILEVPKSEFDIWDPSYVIQPQCQMTVIVEPANRHASVFPARDLTSLRIIERPKPDIRTFVDCHIAQIASAEVHNVMGMTGLPFETCLFALKICPRYMEAISLLTTFFTHKNHINPEDNENTTDKSGITAESSNRTSSAGHEPETLKDSTHSIDSGSMLSLYTQSTETQGSAAKSLGDSNVASSLPKSSSKVSGISRGEITDVAKEIGDKDTHKLTGHDENAKLLITNDLHVKANDGNKVDVAGREKVATDEEIKYSPKLQSTNGTVLDTNFKLGVGDIKKVEMANDNVTVVMLDGSCITIPKSSLISLITMFKASKESVNAMESKDDSFNSSRGYDSSLDDVGSPKLDEKQKESKSKTVACRSSTIKTAEISQLGKIKEGLSSTLGIERSLSPSPPPPPPPPPHQVTAPATVSKEDHKPLEQKKREDGESESVVTGVVSKKAPASKKKAPPLPKPGKAPVASKPPPLGVKLHWKPLGMSRVKGTIFENLATSGSQGGFFDSTTVKRLFSRSSSSSKGVKAKAKSEKNKRGIEILSGKRAQNVEIVLRFSKECDFDSLLDAVDTLDCASALLTTENLSKLAMAVPSESEMRSFKEKLESGTLTTEFRDVEQMILKLASRPNIESKIRIATFVINFRNFIGQTSSQLSTLERASLEVLDSKLLPIFVSAILQYGNFVNHGDSEVLHTAGFSISSVAHLMDFKSNDNSLSSLHYLLINVSAKFPDLNFADMDKSLRSVLEAEKISCGGIEEAFDDMRTELNFILRFSEMLSMENPQSPRTHDLAARVDEIVEMCKREIGDGTCKQNRVFEAIKKTWTFLGEEYKQGVGLEMIFRILSDLVRCVKRVFSDIKEKPGKYLVAISDEKDREIFISKFMAKRFTKPKVPQRPH